jgi:hypothetical protein
VSLTKFQRKIDARILETGHFLSELPYLLSEWLLKTFGPTDAFEDDSSRRVGAGLCDADRITV